MDPINAALWYVERHFGRDITLEEVAASVGVSPFYLTRAFNVINGQPLMRYVRGRRLSEAARELGRGATDILDVALTAGYGSHEAFTRAFRDRFGVTPETVRARRTTANLNLVEPMTMNQAVRSDLLEPRIVDHPALLLAGLTERRQTALR